MTSQEAYITFLTLANKLASNEAINIGKGQFVLLYNKHSRVWLEQRVRKTKATQKIDEIQQLVKKSVPLSISNTTSTYVEFSLPTDWFDNISGYAVCSRGSCKNRIINSYQIKNDNKQLVQFDENWRADFDFEWLPITIGQDLVQVYFTDFNIDGFYMDYFKYPADIQMIGYIDPNGKLSTTNIDPELDDIYVNEILDLVVADVSRIYQNTEKFPLDADRIAKET